jgi:hypothetical protein
LSPIRQRAPTTARALETFLGVAHGKNSYQRYQSITPSASFSESAIGLLDLQKMADAFGDDGRYAKTIAGAAPLSMIFFRSVRRI